MQNIGQTQELKLKCDIHHKKILGFCLQVKCDAKSRFVCFKCSCSNHKHGNYIVLIEEILDFDQTLKSKNYPFNHSGKVLLQFISELKAVQSEENIKDLYDELIKDINQNMNKIKVSTIEAYVQNEEGRAKYIEDVKSHFNKAYTLEGVGYLLKLFSQGEITHDEFQVNMEHFFQADTDEQQEHKQVLCKLMSQDRVKQYLQFDPQSFKKTSEEIQQQVIQIDSSFRSGKVRLDVFKFEIVKAKDYESISILDSDNKVFSINQRGVIVSDRILKKSGTYTIEFHISKYTSGCLVTGLEQEGTLLTSNYWNSKPAYCLSCMNLDAIHLELVKGTYLGTQAKAGQRIVIKFSQEGNFYQINDEKQTNILKMSSTYNLGDQDYRIFFYNYGGQRADFTIDSVTWVPQVTT